MSSKEDNFQYRPISFFPSVLERYYKIETFSFQNDHENLAILKHSNRISVLILSPTHDILRLKKKISLVDFTVRKNVNRLDNQVKGKAKRGAQQVNINSTICTIICDDGSSYRIVACIKGKIIEINKRLTNEPSLLSEKPFTDGYLAIIQPPFPNKDET